MGEVYRARDTKLGRDVALKIISEDFAHDPERLARFQREAHVLASLNHPHIGQIYGLDEAEPAPGAGRAVQFIALELIEGGTLADRLARGPLAVDDALGLARQIAAALEAAHDKGIVHRDLKPANVAMTDEGRTVKVLDFGLAKAIEGPSGPVGVSYSPTITSPAMMTAAGVILGTAAYMSPEQAKGRAADKRSDVWAFGCVLFEMLTGRRAFDGEDVSDTLAAILRGDPDWSALPSDLPPAIVRLLRRCLQKDVSRRLRDVGDARIEIDESVADAPQIASPVAARSSRVGIWVGVFGTALGAIVAAVSYVARPSAPAPVKETRFDVTIASSLTNPYQISISPDGRQIAYLADDASGTPVLWIRPMNGLEPRSIPGTERANNPFWSADSRSVAFTLGGKLMKVDLAGGRPQVLGPGSGRGTWNADGTILMGSGAGPIVKLTADTASLAPVLDLDASTGERAQLSPWFLPDGDRFLYLSRRSAPGASGGTAAPVELAIYAASLKTRARKRLASTDSMPLYADGYMLFIRNGTLLAQRLDPNRLELLGEPVQVADQIAFNPLSGNAAFRASNDGTLIYQSGSGDSKWRLNVVGRDGKQLASLTSPAQYVGVAISPDGKRAAFHRVDEAGGDIWVMEIADRKMSRLTFDPLQENATPVWSPDGSRIAFHSKRENKWGLYAKASNGVGEDALLTESTLPPGAMSWSHDGKFVTFMVNDPSTGWDIYAASLADHKTLRLVHNRFREGFAVFSPDARWIAYSSDETGRFEAYVESFPPGRGKWQISVGGGAFPQWRSDGRELFYPSRDGGPSTFFVAKVNTTGEAFEFSAPQRLFDSTYVSGPISGYTGNYMPWAPFPNGDRFLLPQPDGTSTDNRNIRLTVVLNWTAALKK